MRALASILVALLGCGTVPVTRTGTESAFIPRAPRAVASPEIDALELSRALGDLLSEVDIQAIQVELRRMVADPRFHGRRPEQLQVVLASWGSGPAALDEIEHGYRAWCAAAGRTNCLAGPLTASSVYEVAFDFAMGAEWDGFVREVKSTLDPSTIRIVLLTGLVIFMATLAFPELTSKIPAAIATMALTAYLGAQAVCDLVFGWIHMVSELDAATSFDQVRAAGQGYGRVIGAQTARVLILLATAAIAEGGLIARLMKLPRAAQASAALATEAGGLGLEAVGQVTDARVVPSGVAIAMAAHGGEGRVGGHGALAGKRVGHTFSRHGSANTEELLNRARGSGQPVGQWLDDAAAERFIAERLSQLGQGAKTFDLPEGLGRMINPDGSFTPAKHARLVPSGSGVLTAYPEP